jgi:aconitate hydratase 2/2-methylisocitrate dehydratase
MGNQEKSSQRRYGDGKLYASFKEELLKIQRVKKENPFINTSCGTILGRTPTIEEYKAAVKGINLTQFAPSHKLLAN